MSEKTIVLVTDRGDSNHGEISVLDEPEKAERLVETLLEAGFEADRIKVYTGHSSEFQVSNRPVVALVAEGEEGRSRVTTDAAGQQAAAAEPSAEAEIPAPESGTTDTRDDKVESEEEQAPAAMEVAGPVRFSSLFRSA